MYPKPIRLAAFAACLGASVFAASHRNGPLLLEDQTANLNDFYLFRSYEQGKSDRLVMSMSAQGFQNPDNGPSYYKFSDSVMYRFNINNSRGLDGNPDLVVDFIFNTTLRQNNTFLSYLGTLKSIDDPGILLYQTYTVIVRNYRTGETDYYSTDANGHALSVAPPIKVPKPRLSMKPPSANPASSRSRTACACLPVPAMTRSISTPAPPSTSSTSVRPLRCFPAAPTRAPGRNSPTRSTDLRATTSA